MDIETVVLYIKIQSRDSLIHLLADALLNLNDRLNKHLITIEDRITEINKRLKNIETHRDLLNPQ